MVQIHSDGQLTFGAFVFKMGKLPWEALKSSTNLPKAYNANLGIAEVLAQAEADRITIHATFQGMEKQPLT